MKSDTEKNCQKEKEKEKTQVQIGFNICVAKHYNCKMLLYIFCWHCLPRQEGYCV
jgi:hypothetical protein